MRSEYNANSSHGACHTGRVWLACTLLVAGCSDASDDGGSAGAAAGGSAGASSAAGLGSIAGTGGGAGAGAGKGGSAGATTGAAGVSGGGGAASHDPSSARPTLDMHCADVEPWEASFALSLCDDDTQCADTEYCSDAWRQTTCSGVQQGTSPLPCSSDTQCDAGFECVAGNPSSATLMFCQQIPCDRGEPCPVGYRCDAPAMPGRGCVSLRCDDPDAPACPDVPCLRSAVDERDILCPQMCGQEPATCTTSACIGAYTHDPMINCRYLYCDESGASCPRNYACDPVGQGSGCTRRRCSANADCDCGVCLNGLCRDRAGVCLPMPMTCLAP